MGQYNPLHCLKIHIILFWIEKWFEIHVLKNSLNLLFKQKLLSHFGVKNRTSNAFTQPKFDYISYRQLVHENLTLIFSGNNSWSGLNYFTIKL
jgi:hypothetical protein